MLFLTLFIRKRTLKGEINVSMGTVMEIPGGIAVRSHCFELLCRRTATRSISSSSHSMEIVVLSALYKSQLDDWIQALSSFTRGGQGVPKPPSIVETTHPDRFPASQQEIKLSPPKPDFHDEDPLEDRYERDYGSNNVVEGSEGMDGINSRDEDNDDDDRYDESQMEYVLRLPQEETPGVSESYDFNEQEVVLSPAVPRYNIDVFLETIDEAVSAGSVSRNVSGAEQSFDTSHNMDEFQNTSADKSDQLEEKKIWDEVKLRREGKMPESDNAESLSSSGQSVQNNSKPGTPGVSEDQLINGAVSTIPFSAKKRSSWGGFPPEKEFVNAVKIEKRGSWTASAFPSLSLLPVTDAMRPLIMSPNEKQVPTPDLGGSGLKTSLDYPPPLSSDSLSPSTRNLPDLQQTPVTPDLPVKTAQKVIIEEKKGVIKSVVKSGYLYKKGRGKSMPFLKPWSYRWCTLDTSTGVFRYYYESEGYAEYN